jgi:hypothetical protein
MVDEKSEYRISISILVVEIARGPSLQIHIMMNGIGWCVKVIKPSDATRPWNGDGCSSDSMKERGLRSS